MRNSVRLLTVLSGVLPASLVAGPVLASSVPNTAYDAGPGLTVAQTLGIFVGIPALVIAVIYALVYGLTGRRGPRYPAGQQWTAEPEWFGDRPAASEHGSAAATTEPSAAHPAEPEGGARGQW